MRALPNLDARRAGHPRVGDVVLPPERSDGQLEHGPRRRVALDAERRVRRTSAARVGHHGARLHVLDDDGAVQVGGVQQLPGGPRGGGADGQPQVLAHGVQLALLRELDGRAQVPGEQPLHGVVAVIRTRPAADQVGPRLAQRVDALHLAVAQAVAGQGAVVLARATPGSTRARRRGALGLAGVAVTAATPCGPSVSLPRSTAGARGPRCRPGPGRAWPAPGGWPSARGARGRRRAPSGPARSAPPRRTRSPLRAEFRSSTVSRYGGRRPPETRRSTVSTPSAPCRPGLRARSWCGGRGCYVYESAVLGIQVPSPLTRPPRALKRAWRPDM